MKSTIVGNTSRSIAIEHETVGSTLVFTMTCSVPEPRQSSHTEAVIQYFLKLCILEIVSQSLLFGHLISSLKGLIKVLKVGGKRQPLQAESSN